MSIKWRNLMEEIWCNDIDDWHTYPYTERDRYNIHCLFYINWKFKTTPQYGGAHANAISNEKKRIQIVHHICRCRCMN